MGTIKKIGAIILFVFGGFFAIATIKMIFIDMPKGRKSQNEAVYVGRGHMIRQMTEKQSLSAVR